MRIAEAELLQFIYNRLNKHYGESENLDYMINLQEFIERLGGK